MRLLAITAVLAICTTIFANQVLAAAVVSTSYLGFSKAPAPDPSSSPRNSTTVHATADPAWDTALTSGGNLWAGMHSSDRKASFLFRTDPHQREPTIQTVQSPHQRDLSPLFEKWGYSETEARRIDADCDFDAYHGFKRAFAELGVDTRSSGKGGANQCVQLEHKDGRKVIRGKDGKMPSVREQKYVDESCGKEYRVTDAKFEFGIKIQSGVISLLDVVSPKYSAKLYWGRDASGDELTHIRSISDVAWGFWRMMA